MTAVIWDIILNHGRLGLGAALGIIATALLGKATGRFWAKQVDPALDRMSNARKHRIEIDDKLEQIAGQVFPNGGTSLFDRVTSLETCQSKMSATQAEHSETLALILEAVTTPDP